MARIVAVIAFVHDRCASPYPPVLRPACQRLEVFARTGREQRDLLYEEAPAAYKNIEAVIGDLVAAGLVSVIATLRPLLTYKTRKAHR